MNISMIWAQAKYRVIGYNNSLPWYLPEDLTWFKNNTINKPVIMGRKTFESIGSKPLKNRKNIILSKNKKIYKNYDQFQFADNPNQALKFTKKYEEVMIIGGKKIYEAFLPKASTLYITNINAVVSGNVYFPKYNKKKWKIIFKKYYLRDNCNMYDMCFKIFQLKNNQI
ncbi:MAG: dihydrofolate reductase [Wigglesworthia glossinidia]|nr:dihydrofolate reductase [Wigglesworthia glossinidia]